MTSSQSRRSTRRARRRRTTRSSSTSRPQSLSDDGAGVRAGPIPESQRKRVTNPENEAPQAAAQSISVRLVGMRKEYPGTLAVDFDPGQELAFLAGEIHAVVGENGAGKSTLLSMVAGVTPPTGGEMWLADERHAPANAIDARRSGVDIVLQEPGLIDTMSV